MKILLPILTLLILVGCECAPQMEYIPTTPEERQWVQATVDLQMSKAFPNALTLAGKNQGWADLAERINIEARRNMCRPTMWEYAPSVEGATKTGRWKYVGETAWRNQVIQ